MVGETLKSNLRDRGSNVKNTFKGTGGNIRTLFGDIKERFDLDLETEPPSARDIGGCLGKRGDLLDSVVAAVVRQKDILSGHVQGFARINRKWVNR